MYIRRLISLKIHVPLNYQAGFSHVCFECEWYLGTPLDLYLEGGVGGGGAAGASTT